MFNEIRGGFSEFFLLPCIEEAHSRIGIAVWSRGLEPSIGDLSDRYLSNVTLFSECRRELLALSLEYWPLEWASGYRGLATNVVFYSNAPNTTPLLFRGHIGQSPLRGIVPRYNDLSTGDS